MPPMHKQEWIDNVKRQHPGLEVYHVHYQGRMESADAFFAQPWLIDVPVAVNDTCWDVILVDAPQGYLPTEHPGAHMRQGVDWMQRCVGRGGGRAYSMMGKMKCRRRHAGLFPRQLQLVSASN